GGDSCVLKISPHRVNLEFEREAEQLKLLRECGIPAPRVYAQRTATLDDPLSYVLMEFIDGVDLGEAKRRCSNEEFEELQKHLAEIVATLHDHTGPLYHRVGDQNGKQFESWPAFFRYVYEPIWRECEKAPHLQVKDRKHIERIHERLDEILAHDDRPRLV